MTLSENIDLFNQNLNARVNLLLTSNTLRHSAAVSDSMKVMKQFEMTNGHPLSLSLLLKTNASKIMSLLTHTDSSEKLDRWSESGLESNIYYNEDGYIVDISSLDWSLNTFIPDHNDSGPLLSDDAIPTSRAVTLAFFLLIFVVGVVGHALVVFTVSRYGYARNGTYLYLLNLSVAALLYLVVCAPTLSISHTIVSWPFGSTLCKLNNYVMSVSMSVSVLTITATGLDRYIAVMYPVHSRSFRTTNKAVAVIISTWVLSLVIMSPRIFIYQETQIFHTVANTRVCYRDHRLAMLQLDTALNFVVMYLLPLLVLSFCHFRIGLKLWHSTRPGARSIHTGQIGILITRDRRRIAKIVFAITIVFALGWLPIHVYHLAQDFNNGQVLFGQTVDRGTIALFFSFGANSLNPILYCMFSSSFRKHFKKAFQSCASKCTPSARASGIVPKRLESDQPETPEYRRPPPILLPRPASLLPEPSMPLTVKTFFREFPPGSSPVNNGQREPLLKHDIGNSKIENDTTCLDMHGSSSPLSVGKVIHMEVVDERLEASRLKDPSASTSDSTSDSPKKSILASPGCSEHSGMSKSRQSDHTQTHSSCSAPKDDKTTSKHQDKQPKKSYGKHRQKTSLINRGHGLTVDKYLGFLSATGHTAQSSDDTFDSELRDEAVYCTARFGAEKSGLKSEHETETSKVKRQRVYVKQEPHAKTVSTVVTSPMTPVD